MTKAIITRRTVAAAVGPLLAGGIMIGGMIVGANSVAGAQPATGQFCSSMAMPTVRAVAAPNAMTRAGQVAAARARAVAESMPAQCPSGS